LISTGRIDIGAFSFNEVVFRSKKTGDGEPGGNQGKEKKENVAKRGEIWIIFGHVQF
jgi:hypothetical protein